MYLFERLISVSIYTSFIFIFYILITRIKTKDIKYVLIAYWIIIGIMAFWYKPMESSDLSRLTPIMNGYSNMEFSELLDYINEKRLSTPLEPIYYYIIGKLGNESWLPCITALIVYGLLFNIAYDYFKKNKVTKKNLAIGLLLFMSRGLFHIIIGNIRTGISVSIIAWCVYQEKINDKKIIKNFPLYVIAASMHTIGQILLIIRLVLNITDKNRSSKHKIFYKVTGVILLLIVYYISVKYGIYDRLMRKSESYISKYLEHIGYFYIWEYIINILYISFSFYLYKKNKKITMESGKCDYDEYFKKIIIIDIALIPIEYNLFYRLGWFVAFLQLPFTMRLLNNYENTPQYSKVVGKIQAFSCLILFLEALRGDLCGLKFW